MVALHLRAQHAVGVAVPNPFEAVFEQIPEVDLLGRYGVPQYPEEAKRLFGEDSAHFLEVANYAVPAWELARDVRVRDVRVAFAEDTPGDPDPEVEAAWEELASSDETAEGEGAAAIGRPAAAAWPADWYLHLDEATLARMLIGL